MIGAPLVALSLALVAAGSPNDRLGAAVASEAHTESSRFLAIDVFVDSGDWPLASWQIEIEDETHAMELVGIEGGEHPAFARPPTFDAAAFLHHRVILASFQLDGPFPTHRTRVARLHFRMREQSIPKLVAHLRAATSVDGELIAADVETVPGEEP